MPMKYNPDTGVPYFVPDHAIELEEGITPQPDVITSKNAFFKGDGDKKVTVNMPMPFPPDYEAQQAKNRHIPIEREFDSDFVKGGLAEAKPGHLDYRVATDEEIAEVEQLANKHSVLHWPVLIAIINRLREAERKLASR